MIQKNGYLPVAGLNPRKNAILLIITCKKLNLISDFL